MTSPSTGRPRRPSSTVSSSRGGIIVGTLAAFATFAVGLFARPLGGFVIAHYGDRIGRKPAFVFTVALMGLLTVLIGW